MDIIPAHSILIVEWMFKRGWESRFELRYTAPSEHTFSALHFNSIWIWPVRVILYGLSHPGIFLFMKWYLIFVVCLMQDELLARPESAFPKETVLRLVSFFISKFFFSFLWSFGLLSVLLCLEDAFPQVDLFGVFFWFGRLIVLFKNDIFPVNLT